jgi:hypothetical protein
LISPEFIELLQEQRDLHKREAAFYLAEAEKHGAADEALVSMIQAAKKVVAIMFPVGGTAADAPEEAAPDEPATEDVGDSPSRTEATLAVVPKAATPPTLDEPPATPGVEDLTSEDRAGAGGNMWRSRLLGSRA